VRYRCRFPLQLAQDYSVTRRDRGRASYTSLVDVLHQADVEAEIGKRDFFENREYESASGGRDKKVRILDTRGDILKVDDVADLVRCN
jgi:hypothetical protein